MTKNEPAASTSSAITVTALFMGRPPERSPYPFDGLGWAPFTGGTLTHDHLHGDRRAGSPGSPAPGKGSPPSVPCSATFYEDRQRHGVFRRAFPAAGLPPPPGPAVFS